MDMRQLIGKNFSRIRRELGLTQQQVQERSGFSQQYLSGLEQGKRNPSLVSLFEIADALGVSILDLLEGAPVAKSSEPSPKSVEVVRLYQRSIAVAAETQRSFEEARRMPAAFARGVQKGCNAPEFPFVLTNNQWDQMQLCLRRRLRRIVGLRDKDNRLFIEALIWIVRTGQPWRSLPPELGNWNSVYKRYRDWVRVGIFEEVLTEPPVSGNFPIGMRGDMIVWLDGDWSGRPIRGRIQR